VVSALASPAALGGDRLRKRAEVALKRARATGEPILVSLTAPLPGNSDPTAIAVASRNAGEHWFCFEQPDRDRAAIAALGCVLALEASGENRAYVLARRWRATVAQALADAPHGPPGSGLIATGGLAFAPDGGSSPHWQGFAAASMVVPEVSIARRGSETSITINLLAAPDDTPEELADRARTRIDTLSHAPLPLLDPDPAGTYLVSSPIPPSHYEQAVRSAVRKIQTGELEKIVLAREVQVRAPQDHDPGAVLGVLREAFPSCFVFAVGRGDATFMAASPELLVRRDGQRASTVALAGSTRRSADPAVDAHLGEQLLRSEKDREENAIVARRIARALKPHAVWVTAAPEPGLVQVANIQHLGLPIRAQLSSDIDALQLAGLLHPTPAVGAEPAHPGLELIPALEGLDRGWYAGPVGWTDAAGDGELCVALRCALLRGRVAHCYAGCGIVRDSDAASELAESEIKLGAMLPVLAG
jgi:salicylate biosynthesis isochorismate synthase/menaquinone-specific isochorismate synthase